MKRAGTGLLQERKAKTGLLEERKTKTRLLGEREAGIGWNFVPKSGAGKIVERGQSFSIAVQGNEKAYCIEGIPRLSGEEERLLGKVAELFQKKGLGKEKGLRAFFKGYCMQNLVFLEKSQVEYLLLALESQVFGFGAFDFLMVNPALEEITVIGVGENKPVHVFHCRHGWMKTNLFFLDSSKVKELVNRMARKTGRRLSMNSPVLNATLPDGSRLSAAISPVSFSGPSVTIRKFRHDPFTPLHLVENKTFSLELMAFLWIAMECDCSILIAGNTGSGKTSSLNALLSFVPESERIVVVEETPEIRVHHRHFVKLNVVKEQDVGMQSLIVESLRMRPDRIVVGEVRSREEVSAFVDTMLAGQGKGSYATFHGQSVGEAISRMRCLGILEIDLTAIDLVLVQRRWNRPSTKGNREVRHVVEAAELIGNNGRLELNSLFAFDYGNGRLVKTGKSKKVFEKARQSFCFGREAWEKEIAKRARFLKKLSGKSPSGKRLSGKSLRMKDFFRRVNAWKEKPAS